MPDTLNLVPGAWNKIHGGQPKYMVGREPTPCTCSAWPAGKPAFQKTEGKRYHVSGISTQLVGFISNLSPVANTENISPVNQTAIYLGNQMCDINN